MRRLPCPRAAVLGLVVVAACGATAAPTSSRSTTLTSVPTTAALVECPPAPYTVGTMPARVADVVVNANDIAFDELTSLPATHSTLWVDGDGVLAVALIRGALPPREWPGDKGVVTVDGVDAAVGPFGDGSWVAAWYEVPGDRCDLYTMVFYPPVDPAEVEATLRSLDRTAG